MQGRMEVRITYDHSDYVNDNVKACRARDKGKVEMANLAMSFRRVCVWGNIQKLYRS
jgi:hypothetical protein